MTTREQLKRAVGIDRSDASRGVATEPTPSLPERLYAARERKGVDLYRAERDTKIRARYLGALERGDYKELPGAVYTKGFLRNYALYLGLDPEDVLAQWRRERGEARNSRRRSSSRGPIAAPRKGMTFSPGIVVAALLTVVIVAFGAYLGDPGPALRQAADDRGHPAGHRRDRRRRVDHDLHARGHDACRAPPSRSRRPGREPYQVTADVGRRVGRRGRPPPRPQPVRRQRRSTPRPASGPRAPSACSSPCRSSTIEAPTLTVDQPSEGASFENGAIPVAGTATNAATVVVSATYVGPSGPAPGRRQGDTGPAARPALGDGHGRRGRHVQHAVRADRREVDDHGHGVGPRRARPPP